MIRLALAAIISVRSEGTTVTGTLPRRAKAAYKGKSRVTSGVPGVRRIAGVRRISAGPPRHETVAGVVVATSLRKF